ncbi:MAG TPA: PGPGW domain-containing protein [Rhizomicrobium sp.]|nr:PGPGW domain-containing protein [Rhizomicrobium sp.]
MRRVCLVFLGAFLVAAGLAVTLVPVPLPPVGMASLAGGLALLAAHSRTARRSIQRARHRCGLFSRTVDRVATMAPASTRRALHRTRPAVLARHLQIGARAS